MAPSTAAFKRPGFSGYGYCFVISNCHLVVALKHLPCGAKNDSCDDGYCRGQKHHEGLVPACGDSVLQVRGQRSDVISVTEILCRRRYAFIEGRIEMTPANRSGLSNREVWTAIHYLDPDLEEVYSSWRKPHQVPGRAGELVAKVAISAAALLTAVGFLIAKLLN